MRDGLFNGFWDSKSGSCRDLVVVEFTISTAVSDMASHARSAIYDSVLDCVQFFDELVVFAQDLCQ